MASTISYSLYAQEATNYYTKDTMRIGRDSFEVRKHEYNIFFLTSSLKKYQYYNWLINSIL